MDPKEREMPGAEFTSRCPLAGFEELIDDYRVPPELTQAEYAQIPADLYAPLHDWQTRILTVDPGLFGQELVAALNIVDLLHDHGVLIHGTATRFDDDALSYCWGDPTPCRRLVCNKTYFLVPKEVHDALQRLRSSSETTYIWIDYLCINQCDDAEKSQQVPKMLSIYQKAKAVRVWLGEGNGDVKLAGQVLMKIHSGSVGSFSRLCPHHTRRLISGVFALAASPVFTRVWVKQEVWAASHIVIHTGNAGLLWEALFPTQAQRRLFSSSLRRALQGLRLIGEKLPRGRPIDYARALGPDIANESLRETNAHELDVVNVLRRSTGSRCSLTQDHVYGLLNMSTINLKDGTKTKFTVDYSRSASLVFQDLAKYIARRDRCLDVLLIQHPGTRVIEEEVTAKLKLPSWTPDWRKGLGSNIVGKTIPHTWYDFLYRNPRRGNKTFKAMRYRYEASVGDIDIRWRRILTVRSRDDTEPDGLLRVRGIRSGIVGNISPVSSGVASPNISDNESGDRDSNNQDYQVLQHSKFELLPDAESSIRDTAALFPWVVPSTARTGDVIAFIRGARDPLILRTKQDAFLFIGAVRSDHGVDLGAYKENHEESYRRAREVFETALKDDEQVDVMDLV